MLFVCVCYLVLLYVVGVGSVYEIFFAVVDVLFCYFCVVVCCWGSCLLFVVYCSCLL